MDVEVVELPIIDFNEKKWTFNYFQEAISVKEFLRDVTYCHAARLEFFYGSVI